MFKLCLLVYVCLRDGAPRYLLFLTTMRGIPSFSCSWWPYHLAYTQSWSSVLKDVQSLDRLHRIHFQRTWKTRKNLSLPVFNRNSRLFFEWQSLSSYFFCRPNFRWKRGTTRFRRSRPNDLLNLRHTREFVGDSPAPVLGGICRPAPPACSRSDRDIEASADHEGAVSRARFTGIVDHRVDQIVSVNSHFSTYTQSWSYQSSRMCSLWTG